MKSRSADFAMLAAVSLVLALSAASAEETVRQEPTAQSKEASAAKSEPPVQPIPYSHKKHLALGLKCQQCHPNPDPGDRMTLPPAAKCMSCHVTIAKEKGAIQKLAEFAKSNQPIPWIRVYVVSGWVYWNHRSHLEGNMTCDMCHGQVDQMEVMTKVSDVTGMAGCIDCHRKNDVSTGCRFCHADK